MRLLLEFLYGSLPYELPERPLHQPFLIHLCWCYTFHSSFLKVAWNLLSHIYRSGMKYILSSIRVHIELCQMTFCARFYWQRATTSECLRAMVLSFYMCKWSYCPSTFSATYISFMATTTLFSWMIAWYLNEGSIEILNLLFSLDLPLTFRHTTTRVFSHNSTDGIS